METVQASMLDKKSLRKPKAWWLDQIFVWGILIIPVINFFIFYVYINFNTIVMTFQNMDAVGNTSFAGLENYKWVFSQLADSDSEVVQALGISFLDYALSWLTWPLGMSFAYWVYKKAPGSGTFRLLSMIPSIVSSVLVGMVFLKFVNTMPKFMEIWFGIKDFPALLKDAKTRFPMTMYYGIWQGFGMSSIIYSNAMNGIDKEIIESARLDGVNIWQEFTKIIFPQIFSMATTFIVLGLTSILTDKGPLYLFWQFSAPRDTVRFGYLTYRMTMVNGEIDYPRVATLGILGAMLVTPLTIFVKKFLENRDPVNGKY